MLLINRKVDQFVHLYDKASGKHIASILIATLRPGEVKLGITAEKEFIDIRWNAIPPEQQRSKDEGEVQ